MPSVGCYEKLRYDERLETYIGEFGDSGTAPSTFPALFFFSQPYDLLWFIDRIEFQRRNFDFEMRRARGERRLIVPWRGVDIFVIPPSSRSEVFLSPLMVEIDDRGGPRCLLVPNSSISAYYSGPVFN